MDGQVINWLRLDSDLIAHAHTYITNDVRFDRTFGKSFKNGVFLYLILSGLKEKSFLFANNSAKTDLVSRSIVICDIRPFCDFPIYGDIICCAWEQ